MGLKVCLADLSTEALERAAADVAAVAPTGRAAVLAVPTDVSQLAQVQALKDNAYAAFGEVAVLMNNAGTAPGGGPWEHIERWRLVLEVNLWGVINGVQTFAPAMLAQTDQPAVAGCVVVERHAGRRAVQRHVQPRLADVDPGYDQANIAHLRPSCLVFEPGVQATIRIG